MNKGGSGKNKVGERIKIHPKAKEEYRHTRTDGKLAKVQLMPFILSCRAMNTRRFFERRDTGYISTGFYE